MIRNLSIYNLSGLRVPRTLLMLVLILIGTSVFAQTKQVTGVVKDATGETVIGASVVEKGTTNGVITDFDGVFKLTVSENAVLQISYIGYQTQEVKVAGKTTLDITLREDTEMLEEVVVVRLRCTEEGKCDWCHFTSDVQRFAFHTFCKHFASYLR